MEERLQKIIARAGLSSRRAAEELVLAGHVRINGRVVSELGAKADPQKDRIEVRGQRLILEPPIYLVLHKPRGVVATLSDPEGRPTVKELVRTVDARLFPVGRLDFATSGVLLMTNDGELSAGLLHPGKKVPKTYVLKVMGIMDEPDIERWRRGVPLEDGMTLPAEARLIRHETDKTWLQVTLREGRNQQIRRMGEATGFRVMRLARTSFAEITAEGLRPGEWRPLSKDELLALRERYGVPKRIRSANVDVPAEGLKRARGARAVPSRSERDKPKASRAAAAPRAERENPRARPPAAPRGERENPRARSTSAPTAERRGPRASGPTTARSDRSERTPREAPRRGSKAPGRGGR